MAPGSRGTARRPRRERARRPTLLRRRPGHPCVLLPTDGDRLRGAARRPLARRARAAAAGPRGGPGPSRAATPPTCTTTSTRRAGWCCAADWSARGCSGSSGERSPPGRAGLPLRPLERPARRGRRRERPRRSVRSSSSSTPAPGATTRCATPGCPTASGRSCGVVRSRRGSGCCWSGVPAVDRPATERRCSRPTPTPTGPGSSAAPSPTRPTCSTSTSSTCGRVAPRSLTPHEESAVLRLHPRPPRRLLRRARPPRRDRAQRGPSRGDLGGLPHRWRPVRGQPAGAAARPLLRASRPATAVAVAGAHAGRPARPRPPARPLGVPDAGAGGGDRAAPAARRDPGRGALRLDRRHTEGVDTEAVFVVGGGEYVVAVRTRLERAAASG